MIRPTGDKAVFHTSFTELLNDPGEYMLKHIKIHEPHLYEKDIWLIKQDDVMYHSDTNEILLVKSTEYGNGVIVGVSMKNYGIIDRAALLCADKVDYMGNREPIEVPEFTALRVR